MKWSEFSFILKPSSLGGVGVFATHDIEVGTQVFSGIFSRRKMKVEDVPSDFIKYCIFLSDEECLCPERFDRMEIGWFVNHSDQPNIARREGVNVAVHAIKAGDEILIDYNQLGEPEHLKEAYYKR